MIDSILDFIVKTIEDTKSVLSVVEDLCPPDAEWVRNLAMDGQYFLSTIEEWVARI